MSQPILTLGQVLNLMLDAECYISLSRQTSEYRIINLYSGFDFGEVPSYLLGMLPLQRVAISTDKAYDYFVIPDYCLSQHTPRQQD